ERRHAKRERMGKGEGSDREQQAAQFSADQHDAEKKDQVIETAEDMFDAEREQRPGNSVLAWIRRDGAYFEFRTGFVDHPRGGVAGAIGNRRQVSVAERQYGQQ